VIDQKLLGWYIKTMGVLGFGPPRRIGHWNLPFDLAQGGELVEPFVIWDLSFGA
jgi:hypothetical protein